MSYSFGAGFLFATRTDLTNQTPQLFGTLQDISVEFSASSKELYGQYQFPQLVARGQGKIQCKAKFGRISANLFNSLFFGGTVTAGQTAIAISESGTVPAQTNLTTSAITASGNNVLTFTSTAGLVVGQTITGTNIAAATTVQSLTSTTVTMSQNTTGSVASGASITFGPSFAVSNAATFVQDEGVYYKNTGMPLIKVASAPTQGQYSVSANGVYSYNVADIGASLYTSYTFGVAASGQKLTLVNPQVGVNPVFSAQLFTQATTPTGLTTAVLNLRACVGSKLSLATKIEDFTIPELDFSAFADAAGNIFDWSFNEVA